MPAVNFRLAPALHEKLVSLCEKRDITVTKFYQDLTERVIDHIDDLAYIPQATQTQTTTIPQRVKRILGSQPQGFAIDGTPIFHAVLARFKTPKKDNR